MALALKAQPERIIGRILALLRNQMLSLTAPVAPGTPPGCLAGRVCAIGPLIPEEILLGPQAGSQPLGREWGRNPAPSRCSCHHLDYFQSRSAIPYCTVLDARELLPFIVLYGIHPFANIPCVLHHRAFPRNR